MIWKSNFDFRLPILALDDKMPRVIIVRMNARPPYAQVSAFLDRHCH